MSKQHRFGNATTLGRPEVKSIGVEMGVVNVKYAKFKFILWPCSSACLTIPAYGMLYSDVFQSCKEDDYGEITCSVILRKRTVLIYYCRICLVGVNSWRQIHEL